MRHPRLNRQVSTRVSIPLLEGGINTKDNATLINDNQLTDAKNVWFDGQTLKTRPKLENLDYSATSEDEKTLIGEFNRGNSYQGEGYITRVYQKGANLIFDSFSNDGQVLSSTESVFVEGYGNYKAMAYIGNGNIFIVVKAYNLNSKNLVVMVYESVGRFDSFRQIYKAIYENGNLNVETDNLYKPLLYLNGKGNRYSYLPITTDTEYAPASIYEGANVLPSGIRLQFNTDGFSSIFKLPLENLNFGTNASIKINVAGMGIPFEKDGVDTNEIKLNLSHSEFVGDSYKVKEDSQVEVFGSDEGYVATTDIEFEEGKTYYKRRKSGKFSEITGSYKDIAECKESLEKRGYMPYVYEHTGEIVYSIRKVTYKAGTEFKAYFLADDGEFGFVAVSNEGEYDKEFVLPASINNNIEITVYKFDENNLNSILGVNLCTIYGGCEGIFGGTRTFLAGYKNKVCWSGADKPTYFSENNYISVGDNTPITAFGKMDDSLVLFKKNAIYCTKTYTTDGITAEQVQNGSVVDVSASGSYFPIFQLSDEYGCDLPNTVKLCLNRLVFANTDGNVYCIVTQSNSSRRNVYCISGMIRKKIKAIDDSAFSINFGDYYLLVCKDKVWALNYNKDSFRYVYSYTNKTNNSSTRYFTWWYWEFDKEFITAIKSDDKLYLFSDDNENLKSYHLNTEESDSNCECFIKTKVFDFGIADRYKKIEKLSISVGNDIYADIEVIIETDSGEVYHRLVRIDCNAEGSRYSAQYGSQIRIIPSCNKVKRFAIVLKTQGVMSIENLYINYKVLGEVMS